MLHKIGHSITKLDIRTETPVSVNINENGRLQNKAEWLLRKFNLETISEFEEQIATVANALSNSHCTGSREWSGFGKRGTSD